MPLVEPVIRPPSEAESFLLQVTLGCSANSCTFCGAYRGRPFRVKDRKEIEADIDEWRRIDPGTRRVFLLDGDALAAGNDLLVPVLSRLGRAFPRLARAASYANGRNITGRSRGELAELASAGLRLVYLGLESGSQEVLDRCRKRSTVEEMIETVHRCREAGIKSSAIVSVIAVAELTTIGRNIISDTYMSFEIWFTIAAVYMAVTLILSVGVTYLERRYAVDH